MSLAQLRNEIGRAFIGAVLALVMGIALAVLTGAWSLKENKADHDRDLLELRTDQQRTLDVVCDAYKSQPRACTNQNPVYPRP